MTSVKKNFFVAFVIGCQQNLIRGLQWTQTFTVTVDWILIIINIDDGRALNLSICVDNSINTFYFTTIFFFTMTITMFFILSIVLI